MIAVYQSKAVSPLCYRVNDRYWRNRKALFLILWWTILRRDRQTTLRLCGRVGFKGACEQEQNQDEVINDGGGGSGFAFHACSPSMSDSDSTAVQQCCLRDRSSPDFQ